MTARHPMLSAAWFAVADVECAQDAPDAERAVRIGLRITDAPEGTAREAELLADLDTGGLRVRRRHADGRPTCVLELRHAAARKLLFGTGAERTALFEDGQVLLEGAYMFVFFLDRLLQQDRFGAVARLRARTAGVPETAYVSQWPAGAAAAVPEDEASARLLASDLLPHTMAALEKEIGVTTPGAQLYVAHRPSGTAVSVALGEARPGVAFTRDSAPMWYCAAKSVGTVAFGLLWERGLLSPDEPVATYVPAFTGDGRERITLRQLLTHTTPVPMALDPLHGALTAPLEVRRELVYSMAVPRDARAGQRINYSPWWAWLVLADVLTAVDGRGWERFLTEEVLLPCGMGGTRIVLSEQEYRARAERLPLFYVTGNGLPAQPTHWWATRAGCTEPLYGVNTRGPIRDLGRLYEMLLAEGAVPGDRVLGAPTVAALTARHRVGLSDPYGNADWGLGLRVESRHLGERFTSFSRYASPRTFGHYGLWTSSVFADPEAGLVTAFHLNGKTLQDDHQRRILALGDAVYEDLGLVP